MTRQSWILLVITAIFTTLVCTAILVFALIIGLDDHDIRPLEENNSAYTMEMKKQ